MIQFTVDLHVTEKYKDTHFNVGLVFEASIITIIRSFVVFTI